MIKRTLYFGSPAHLSKKNEQVNIYYPDAKSQVEQNLTLPIEDIGIIVLDNPNISVTHVLLSSLLENNTAVIVTNAQHLPAGLFLPLYSNFIQSELYQNQISSSKPLQKQLWQQTISAKIANQAAVLSTLRIPSKNMMKWSKEVKTGDSENLEARAASFYWKNIFSDKLEFTRDRYGDPPNNLLNYGYSILRAVVARCLVSSGLIPTLGIHHHNKYNAFCLADDIMEPYRPYVDLIVREIVDNGEDFSELSKSIKQQLLKIPALDVYIEGKQSPLMIAVQRTTSTLSKCYSGETRKIIYPEIPYEFF